MIKKPHNTPTSRHSFGESDRVRASVAFIRSKTKLRPKIAVILGSGLGDFTKTLTQQFTIEVSSIPHYPRLSVEGHHGKIVFGKSGGVSVLAFQGRAHYYETGNLETVLYPVRVAKSMGITTLIVTNAAGGVNESFHAGDLMVITDHINLTFENPLIGVRPSVTHATIYDEHLRDFIMKSAEQNKILLQQ
ncbi:MAG TPA: purine-nucleoside phosphorylase, partial [Saprospiraceae bacterium]|nr:purine-nucleoside phosphorylase [Saprospiraceae bacterium]